MGLDGNVRVNRTTNLAWQYGRSSNTVQSASGGDAMSLNATFGGGSGKTVGRWNGTLGWRNIGDTYAGIDSISNAFLRAEKGLRGTLAYSPTSFLSLTSSMNQSQIGSQALNTGTDGTQQSTFSWNNNTQYQGGFSLSLRKLPRLDFTHSQIEQKASGGIGSTSHYASDQANVNYQVGILGVSGSLGRTLSRGQSVFATGFTNTLTGGPATSTTLASQLSSGTFANSSATDSQSDTGRLTLSLSPFSWLNINTATGVSRTRYGSSGTSGVAGSSSDARDNSLGARLQLRENLSFGFDLANSTNGRTDLQSSSQTGIGIASQRTQTTAFDVRYQPRPSIELTAQVGHSLQLVPGYENSDSTTTALGITFAPIPQFTFFGSLSGQKLRYLGSQQGNSDDTTFQFQATAGPFARALGPLKKMTYSASWQHVNTGSALATSLANTGNGSSLIGTTGGVTPISTGGAGSLSRAAAIDPGYTLQKQFLSLWSLRADYPVATRQTLYFSWQAIDSRSPLSGTTAGSSYYTASNYQRGNGAVGYDYRLNEYLSLTTNWNLIQVHDREKSDLSYQARAFNMDLSMKF